MPRNGQGGRRQGAPGKAYPNRTDMNQNRQPVTVASGQPYGARQEQVAAQRALPLPAAPPVPAPPPPAPGALPGGRGPFTRPTEYPNEPLTAGMSIGPGPGPEALAGNLALSPDDAVLADLMGLYRVYPNRDLARLIEAQKRRLGMGA